MAEMSTPALAFNASSCRILKTTHAWEDSGVVARE
jgi:hypothetical protein